MTALRDRIAACGSAGQMGTYHPYGTGATPMVMPLALVEVHEEGMRVQSMTPIFAADGAPIPATAPGSWGQVRAAGRP